MEKLANEKLLQDIKDLLRQQVINLQEINSKITERQKKLVFGIEFNEIKNRLKLNKKNVSKLLICAKKNGLIDIQLAHVDENGILKDYAIINLIKEDYENIRNNLSNKTELIK